MESNKRSPRQWLLLFLKGLAMGVADSVPGVSGGTVAFMTNIYEELVFSLQSVNPKALKILFSEGVAACWKHLNGNFLLVVLAGIATSLLTVAGLMVYLLESFPHLVFSLFAGMILASTVFLVRHTEGWHKASLVYFLAGALLAVLLGLLPEAENASPSLVFIFAGGAVAITAMILPGISGAFILVLLGLYGPVYEALHEMKLTVIVVFVAGCATGILLFSHILAWLFRHHRKNTLTVLTGILAGSLYALWPWQLESQGAVLPGEFLAETGIQPRVLLCTLLLIIGFILVMGLETISKRRE